MKTANVFAIFQYSLYPLNLSLGHHLCKNFNSRDEGNPQANWFAWTIHKKGRYSNITKKLDGLKEFLMLQADKLSFLNSVIEFYLKIGLFYLSGEPILLHLLRYRALAVEDHSFVP